MTKPISDYTVDELSAKIEAIKVERERTATIRIEDGTKAKDCLKEIEE